MSKSMLDTAAGETFMGREIEVAKKLLNDMQDNHVQWQIERTNTKKVNDITETNNEELTSKVDELIDVEDHTHLMWEVRRIEKMV